MKIIILLRVFGFARFAEAGRDVEHMRERIRAYHGNATNEHRVVTATPFGAEVLWR